MASSLSDTLPGHQLLPLLVIRNAVLFPGAVAPYDVGRERSVALVKAIGHLSQPVIAIFAQRNPDVDDPGEGDIYHVGTAAKVLKCLEHSADRYSLILQGLTRVRLDSITQHSPYLKAKVSQMTETSVTDDVEAEALTTSLRGVATQVIQLMPEVPRETQSLVDSIQEPGSLADLLAANLDAPVEEKAQLMNTLDVKERVRQVLKLLVRQREILKMRERINAKIKEDMAKDQREYVLRQQAKAIAQELLDPDEAVKDEMARNQREYVLRQQAKAIAEELSAGEDHLRELRVEAGAAWDQRLANVEFALSLGWLTSASNAVPNIQAGAEVGSLLTEAEMQITQRDLEGASRTLAGIQAVLHGFPWNASQCLPGWHPALRLHLRLADAFDRSGRTSDARAVMRRAAAITSDAEGDTLLGIVRVPVCREMFLGIGYLPFARRSLAGGREQDASDYLADALALSPRMWWGAEWVLDAFTELAPADRQGALRSQLFRSVLTNIVECAERAPPERVVEACVALSSVGRHIADKEEGDQLLVGCLDGLVALCGRLRAALSSGYELGVYRHRIGELVTLLRYFHSYSRGSRDLAVAVTARLCDGASLALSAGDRESARLILGCCELGEPSERASNLMDTCR